MKRIRYAAPVLAIVAAVALGVVWAAGTDTEVSGPGVTPELESIKQLAGSWVEIGDDGRPTDKVVSVFRVTGAGSAVIETLFPGSDHEMVTVYHQDGDDLVLTHYCAEGNQPRMKARRGDGPRQLVFEFTGGGNMASTDEAHMHRAVFTWIDDDRLDAEWQRYKDGAHDYTAAFKLARQR